MLWPMSTRTIAPEGCGMAWLNPLHRTCSSLFTGKVPVFLWASPSCPARTVSRGPQDGSCITSNPMIAYGPAAATTAAWLCCWSPFSPGLRTTQGHSYFLVIGPLCFLFISVTGFKPGTNDHAAFPPAALLCTINHFSTRSHDFSNRWRPSAFLTLPQSVTLPSQSPFLRGTLPQFLLYFTPWRRK